MTEIDLVDWTMQEARHLKADRHEPSDVNEKSSIDKLIAVFEREPVARTDPEGPVALIAGIPPTVEEPVARPSSETAPRSNQSPGPIYRPSPRPYHRALPRC